MKNKLSPIPKLVGNTVFRSGEKSRRLGEVVFIQDESTLLLAVPDPEEEEEEEEEEEDQGVPSTRGEAKQGGDKAGLREWVE